MCGTAKWEWDESRFAYTAIDEFCQGCYMKSVYSNQESSDLPGTNVKLVPTTKIMSAKSKVKAMRRSKMLSEAKEEAEAERGRDAAGSLLGRTARCRQKGLH